MARSDSRYVGFEDERVITEVMLRALPRVCKAREDRRAWLISMASSVSSAPNDVHVQGGDVLCRAEKYVEALDGDRLLGWLSTIEVRLADKLSHLSRIERAALCAFYFSGDKISNAEMAKRIGVKSVHTARSIRLRAFDKMVRPCTSVYHLFCLWREQDDVALEKRRAGRVPLDMKKGAA